MDLFVKIVGLCRPTYVFFITFVNGILETEYRNYANLVIDWNKKYSQLFPMRIVA